MSERKCLNCDGAGQVLLMKSWFTADGYRRAHCVICDGSGVNPPGFLAAPGHAEFLHTANDRIKSWGALRPRAA